MDAGNVARVDDILRNEKDAYGNAEAGSVTTTQAEEVGKVESQDRTSGWRSRSGGDRQPRAGIGPMAVAVLPWGQGGWLTAGQNSWVSGRSTLRQYLPGRSRR
jgi:hypothetical protein